jgi:hypothetical protein
MKYLFLLYGEPIPPAGTPAARTLLDDWTAARRAMEEAGVLISCAPLYPPQASTTVRVRDGEPLLTDGPAAEIKEQFGGYTLVECANLDEALAWAAKIPTAKEGMVEVRPVIQVPAPEAAGQAPGTPA